ncbi:MAG: response regulator [Ruminiclostridium sp.]|nr:response regulator [Ruminiclostridium sp.]
MKEDRDSLMRKAQERRGGKTRSDYIKIILITLTLLLVSGMNVSLIFGMMSSQTEQIGRIQLKNVGGDLQETISDAERVVMQLAMGVEQIRSASLPFDELEKYIYAQKDEQVSVSSSGCMNLYAAGSDWQIIPGFDAPKDFHAAERLWYKGAVEKSGDSYVSEPYIDIVSGNMCFTISMMLSDGDTVVSADFDLSRLQDSVSRMVENNGQNALIVSGGGVVIGFNDMSYAGTNIRETLPEYAEVFDRVLSSNEHRSFGVNIDGKSRTVFSTETNNEWYMILLFDTFELYRDNIFQLILNTLLNLALVLAIIIVYLRGVSNRIKAEKALRVKEDFLSGLSGELKEPLNSVLRNCDAMLADTDPHTAETVTVIKEAGIRLSEMLNNLFSYSRIVSAKEEKATARRPRERIELPKASRLSRNAVIAILAVTLLSSQVICISSTDGWGKSKLTLEAATYENQLSQWVEGQKSILSMFVNMISERPEMLDDYDEAVKWLNDVGSNYPEISVVYMTNPYKEHTVIMSSGWEPEEGWKVEERAWYIATEKSPDGFSVSQPYYDDQTGNYCITMSQIVYGPNNEFLGIFGIDYFMDKLINILGESYTKNGYAFLVDTDGIIINHPNSEYQMSVGGSTSIEDTSYAAAYHDDGGSAFVDYDGSLRACTSKRNELTGFTVVAVNSWWLIYGNTIIFAVLFLLLFGICITSVIILINRLIKWQETANKKLKEAADIATTASKARSDFLAQMSHEIRTPINAVLGMNEMILRESRDEEILDYASNIRRAGNNLLNLINNILDLSKIENGKMEIVQVSYEIMPLLDDIICMIRERANKKGLALNVEIDPELPKSLYGDDVRLRQIITNILTNALKYTHNGSITLHTSGELLDNDTFELYVRVTDTGIGIREEDMDKLFRSFQRLDEEKNRNIEGTGLGISIVQSFLSMMGSRLEVESEYGQGSSFYFRVKQKIIDKTPAGSYEAYTAVSEERAVSTGALTVYGAKILVVDDNDMNLKVVKGLMKQYGIVPDLASSGMECIGLVRKCRYDILFLDHLMPEMDGIETLKKLRDEKLITDETTAVALTANALGGAKDYYIEAGFRDYLSKPIEIANLEKLLRKYLPQERFIAPTARPRADLMELLKESGFNADMGSAYAGGSRKVYLDELNAFVRGSSGNIAKLRSAADRQSFTEYGKLCAELKTAARMIGADKLSNLALKSEMSAKTADEAGMTEELEKLLRLYEKTSADISNILRNI